MYAREWLLAIDEKDMSFGGERRWLDAEVWPSDLAVVSQISTVAAAGRRRYDLKSYDLKSKV